MNARNGIETIGMETDDGCIIEQAIREVEAIASYFEAHKYYSATLLVHGPDERPSASALTRRAIALILPHWETDGGCFVQGNEFTDEAWAKYLRAGEIIAIGRRYPGTLAGFMVDQGRTTYRDGNREDPDYFRRFEGHPIGSIRSDVARFPGKPMTLVCVDAYRALGMFLRQVLKSEFQLNGNRRRCYRYEWLDFQFLMNAFETKPTRNAWQAAIDGTDSDRLTIADKMPNELQSQRLALATVSPVNSAADLKRLMFKAGGFPADYIAREEWLPCEVLPILEAAAAQAIDATRSPEDVLNDEWAKSILPETPFDKPTSAKTVLELSSEDDEVSLTDAAFYAGVDADTLARYLIDGGRIITKRGGNKQRFSKLDDINQVLIIQGSEAIPEPANVIRSRQKNFQKRPTKAAN